MNFTPPGFPGIVLLYADESHKDIPSEPTPLPAGIALYGISTAPPAAFVNVPYALVSKVQTIALLMLLLCALFHVTEGEAPGKANLCAEVGTAGIVLKVPSPPAFCNLKAFRLSVIPTMYR